ncbi:hypothetical protein ATJ88_1285 [Isoptericola jiangsuensis]|uniref:Uncharacterized protein n=1 Tax=Isoptericola jiangsuensis TaxID=548579 RepID=A0A2A9EWE8_9MICO|nr:hypothetical protein [Isoptericola jiangsuensis]PFG42622.1 hypothetical protein ATJ88_1285 [Isoptericola jiangsuensis]
MKTFRFSAPRVRSDRVDARNLRISEALVRAPSLTAAQGLLRQHGLVSKDWRRAFVRDEDVLDVPGVGQVAWRDVDAGEGQADGPESGWVYVPVDEFLQDLHARFQADDRAV